MAPKISDRRLHPASAMLAGGLSDFLPLLIYVGCSASAAHCTSHESDC
jgi:hypothetical protein